MIINTRDFGEVEVSEDELITFPVGVFAFEDTRQFALMSPLGEDVFPKWLQSAESTAPCFVVFDPAVVDKGYSVKLEAYEEDLLKFPKGSADNKSMELLVIATVPSDFKKTTVNMKAPIVINREKRLAAQVILTADYDFKFPLYSDDAPEKAEGTGE